MTDIMLTHVRSNTHARFLYELLVNRDPGVSISHREMPTFDEHLAFIESKPYAAWYIISPNPDIGPDIGSIYLTHRDEVGIHISRGNRGSGIGLKATQALMRMHPRPRYLANIAPGNAGSLRFFQRLGFTCIQHTMELSCPSKS